MAYSPEEKKNAGGSRPDASPAEPRPSEPPRYRWSQDEADLTLNEILRRRQERTAQAETAPAGQEAGPSETALQSLSAVAARESEEDLPVPEAAGEAAADTRSRGRRFLDRVLYILGGIVPHRGDSAPEVVRKCVFLAALITLIVSLAYIINDMVIQPLIGEMNYNTVRDLYDPDNPVDPPADYDPANYPEGIMDSFKALYALNSDVRGWMTYADENGSWLDIDYPVMYSGDNSYYLDHNFQKAKHKDGALFFDQRNRIDSPDSENKVLIVYGHNMASGHMFAALNDFLNTTYGLSYARSAPVINLDTLFERSQYKVFAVMLLNTRAEDGPYFDYLRTAFTGDADFMDFVAEIRARSLFDYGDVAVDENDELLILSTCTAPSGAKFEDGRCVVVARKVRDGESAAVNTGATVKNDDVIMPLAWYTNQGLEPHPYYTGGFTIPNMWEDSGTIPPVATTTTTASPNTTTGGTTAPPVIVPTTPPTSPPADPTEPAGPTEPTDPTEPTGSTEPTEPTGPTDPTEPTGPTGPTDPTEPAGPAEPTGPTEPAEPTDPAETTEGPTAPPTEPEPQQGEEPAA
ncbi:MAG TPA: sortase [Firmicutes bacterium]|nr:sortase [Bacillota bacterium]